LRPHKTEKTKADFFILKSRLQNQSKESIMKSEIYPRKGGNRRFSCRYAMKKKHLSPLLVIVLSFFAIIVVGALLLKLPWSVQEGQFLSWVDSIFLSTSAVCVTGLSPVLDLSATLSIFGKIVMMILIQTGGLGIVTIAIYVLVLLGVKIGITERYVIREALNQNSLGGMIKLVRAIVFTSLIIEFIGFGINMIVFVPKFPFLEAVGISAFHAVSAFNNAGFDLLGSTSLIAYAGDVLLNINTMVMITLGGIGFVVIHDVVRKRSWKNLTLYSKIVLKTSLVLIVGGMLLIKLFEWGNVTWLQALFQSVTSRTAGFATTDIALLSDATTLVLMLLMFIGASPNSTGGGVKTTTAYTIYKSITSFLTGKPTIIRSRKIDDETKYKAFALVILSAFSIFVVFLALSSIESKNPASNSTFINILFETISAFGTVGLSRGLTPELLASSKLIISALMFLGRLGPITIFGIWNKNWGHPYASNVDYAPEKILIG